MSPESSPTMVITVVVSDQGDQWLVTGWWDVSEPMRLEAMRQGARWLIDQADDVETAA